MGELLSSTNPSNEGYPVVSVLSRRHDVNVALGGWLMQTACHQRL